MDENKLYQELSDFFINVNKKRTEMMKKKNPSQIYELFKNDENKENIIRKGMCQYEDLVKIFKAMKKPKQNVIKKSVKKSKENLNKNEEKTNNIKKEEEKKDENKKENMKEIEEKEEEEMEEIEEIEEVEEEEEKEDEEKKDEDKKENVKKKEKNEEKKKSEKEHVEKEEKNKKDEEIKTEKKSNTEKEKKLNKELIEEKNEENIEKNYLGIKGIIKRTIGTGRINVKVNEKDENESFDEELNVEINKQLKEKYKNENKYIDLNKNEKNEKDEKDEKDEKEPIIYNIDGNKFIIKASYNYTSSSGNEQNIDVKFSTNCSGPKIMHWGIYKTGSPKAWSLPPKASYPNFTNEVNGGKALETKFPNSLKNGQRIISMSLPRKVDDENIEGIHFTIFDPMKKIWYNNNKTDFNVKFE